MIKELYIENVAVIKKADISFETGMCVITGETGAGKSILIDSINAILGQRVSKDIIRTGEEKASVIAKFFDIDDVSKSVLDELGITYEDDEIILQRDISLNSKGSARVNGKPVAVSTLRQIGVNLVSINGQNESYELLNPMSHLKYIDATGDYKDKLKQYKELFNKLSAIKSSLKGFNLDEAQKAREIDILEYQISEIEEVKIMVGESEQLQERRNIIANSENIARVTNLSKMLLNGDEQSEGGIPAIQTAINELISISDVYPKMEEITGRLQTSLYDIIDCAEEISNLADEVEFDPKELNDIETRLNEIDKLKAKYGTTEKEILDFLENAKRRLMEISFADEKREQLETEYKTTLAQANKMSEYITQLRIATAKKFSDKVKDQLTFLDMPKVDFRVSVKPIELNINGADEVQFLISVNPGETPKPISKIASGGELSRIMLAIKTVLNYNDDIDTLIFDEIDTGVSGSTSQKIGLKLKEVSKKGQVMCVTHSAQIAALADNHFLISKEVKDDRTYTDIKLLDFEGRKLELARIIGGVKLTELTLKNAEEMLNTKNYS